MAYALESMLRIRKMREDRASEALVAARHAQEKAATELRRRERKHGDWLETKEERRDRVFAPIMGVSVTRDAIDIARETVSGIDEEGILLHDGVVRAKAELETRVKEAEQARGRHVAAMRDHEKIEQHKSVWREEDRRAQEYASDAELEEFAGRKMTDDDSDDFD